MAAGLVSRAIFSTHLRRWLFSLKGTAGLRTVIVVMGCIGLKRMVQEL